MSLRDAYTASRGAPDGRRRELFPEVEGGGGVPFLEGDGVEAIVDVEDGEKKGEEGANFDVPTFPLAVVALDFIAQGEGGGDPHQRDKPNQIIEAEGNG